MKKLLRTIGIILCGAFLFTSLSGCSFFQSAINDFTGSLVGNSYQLYTYDNYGELTMETSGDKISISGNQVASTGYDSEGNTITNYDLSSVITITIDGYEMESCGDTCIFVQDGLDAEVDFSEEIIESSTDGSLMDNASIARLLNRYKNAFGKSRIVVIKSQLGQPITAYSGDDVYWEIPDNIPKCTKLMIDGKALYIHRANFQIIDSALIE